MFFTKTVCNSLIVNGEKLNFKRFYKKFEILFKKRKITEFNVETFAVGNFKQHNPIKCESLFDHEGPCQPFSMKNCLWWV